ncbi:MAG: glycosyl hydrolase [Bacteroidota bacterium]|nr:glycosyl hydrolase [Bacteroidota bacterium]
MRRLTLLLALILAWSVPLQAQDIDPADVSYSALKLRNIGPAFTSGRIADIAIHPEDDNVWYVAVGSGGVWRTVNAGTTWESLFDSETSYSIGAITIDGRNPHTIWVGTGENVGGRHVAYGDGIYRSDDGGKSWTNMGLKTSNHISRIIIHPDNSDVVWVAAQGPLWSAGGERGLYMTTDGGQTWTRTLGNNQWVGVTDVVINPIDPMVLYAATWQRHRNVAAYMGGGPGSGLHKSTDGGLTWTEMTRGIPTSNLGKIGLAISPQNPDRIYAAIELDRTSGGVFMSADRGVSWTKMSDAVSGATGPHYYQELYASPHVEGRLYLMDWRVQVSDDHGRTFTRMSERDKHSDNHAIAFRMDDPDYILMGTDGGLFETYDDTRTWRFITNLPVTQYYKVAVDDSEPFYRVFGGTQDNGSHGGPSRTDNVHGIRNADWFKTLGADGHQSATEPGNPDIIYAEAQQGRLARIDLITGEQVMIQPQAGPGEKFERYNWDAPIVVSPHRPTTIYFGSYRVWKSTDRGDSWEAISPDLTRDEERLALPIMGRTQSYDNPWDFNAMSVYNTITSLAESPMVPGLIYAGTDDGLIQVTDDDGASWHRLEVGDIPGIPATAFVNNLYADLHDSDVVYAALDNHKFGDLSPYLIKSSDRGRSWTSIVGNLPDRTLIWRIVQDHVNADLLFTATEFGVYFTTDGGGAWIKVNSDANISFRDITIQKRENDVVAASFGRGFFILDDYTSLRDINPEVLSQQGHLFPIRTTRLFVPRDVAGGSQGTDYFEAPNPPHGALITYYLRDSATTLRQARSKREKELGDADIPFPGWDALEAEINEVADQVVVLIRNSEGEVAGRVTGPASKGLHRVNWDMRYPSKNVVTPGGSAGFGGGILATPGTYTASLIRISQGAETMLSGPVSFEVVPLHTPALAGSSPEQIAAFRKDMESLQQRMSLLSGSLDESMDRVAAIQTAHERAYQPDAELTRQLHAGREFLLALELRLRGHEARRDAGERNPPTVQYRLSVGFSGLSTTYGPTAHHRSTVDIGRSELADLEAELAAFNETFMPGLEARLSATGAPPVRE